MARPRKQINFAQVEALATIGATDEEIATVLGISTNTVGRRKKDNDLFAEALKRGRDKGKVSLRRLQWQSAQKGNVAMQIFLGKQLLGQRDHRETGSKSSDGESLLEIFAEMRRLRESESQETHN